MGDLTVKNKVQSDTNKKDKSIDIKDYYKDEEEMLFKELDEVFEENLILNIIKKGESSVNSKEKLR